MGWLSVFATATAGGGRAGNAMEVIEGWWGAALRPDGRGRLEGAWL